MISKAFRLVAAAGLLLSLAIAPAAAQDKPRIKVGSLTLPVFAPIVVNIMKAKGFDAKNGFELDIVTYPSIAAYYAGLATGEVDTLIGGPTFFQKLRLEGVPIKIVATGATLSDLLVLTADPAIKNSRRSQGQADRGRYGLGPVSDPCDLRGLERARSQKGHHHRQREFCGRARAARRRPRRSRDGDRADRHHDDEGKSQSEAGIRGQQSLEGIVRQRRLELVYAMREDSIKRVPDMPKMFLAALQDVTAFLKSNPDEADKIASETVKLPPGILKEAVASGRWRSTPSPRGPMSAR